MSDFNKRKPSHNQRSSGNPGGPRPSSGPKPKSYGNKGASGNQAAPRNISSNYTVDLFHHQLGASQKPPRGEWQGNSYGPPSRASNSHASNPRRSDNRFKPRSEPKAPPARKGYTNFTFEMKDELYKKFTGKLKHSSKTPKEVINQLISFYNMDKIKI